MMDEAIRNFARQFEYEPRIENDSHLEPKEKFIVVGMGGSHLAADILKSAYPHIPLSVHANYGLPPIPEDEMQQSLVIAVSYSGNTKEAIDAFAEAKKRNIARIAVATGGELLEMAQNDGEPYVQLPEINIQPRLAIGYCILALAKIVGREDIVSELRALTDTLTPAGYEQPGKRLAERLLGTIPVIYASMQNSALAYNWKIAFNETGKTPAFCNVFPEMNHNEITSFTESDIPGKFSFLILKDLADDERIRRRMTAFEDLYRSRNLAVEAIEVTGAEVFHKLFSSIMLAYWTAYHLALTRNVDPEAVPVIEEFKKRIK